MKQTLRLDDQIGRTLVSLIRDAQTQFQFSMKNQEADIKQINVRLVAEKLGFVTKTLPAFGKHFDACLKTGSFTPTSLFKRGKGVLPSFLQGLTKKVFGTDGALLSSPDCHAIRYIRQICGMFYKLEMDYSEELTDGCIDRFVVCDRELFQCDTISLEQSGVIHIAQDLITRLFQDFDPKDIIPRPGPGQTADRCQRQHRYEPHVKYTDLHEQYPYYSYFYMNSDHLLDFVRSYRSLPNKKSGVSRLSLVPKDSRGPRIICMEPHEYMWLQQGLGRKMMDWMEQHPLTSGHVNFHDQTINGKLALQSSIDREYATLDMKEASDRISTSLVDTLFEGVPTLKNALLALSTPDIELPNGVILHKKKYAPMGSALCFPVMSIVHYVLGVAAMEIHHPGVPQRILRKALYVYGDDIIVKTKYSDALLEEFPLFGLLFNRAKCCIEGFFRESCGVDAYAGVDVTPKRIKLNPHVPLKPTDLPSIVAVCNGLYYAGMLETSLLWKDWIEEHYGEIPFCSEDSSVVGWTIPLSQLQIANKAKWKWDKKLQSWTIRARIIVPQPHASMVGGWVQMMRAQVHSPFDSTSLARRDHIRLKWKRIPISAA